MGKCHSLILAHFRSQRRERNLIARSICFPFVVFHPPCSHKFLLLLHPFFFFFFSLFSLISFLSLHVLVEMGQARELLRVLEVPCVDVHRRRRYVCRWVRGQEDLGGKGETRGEDMHVSVSWMLREMGRLGTVSSFLSHPALPPSFFTCIPFWSHIIRYCRSSLSGLLMPSSRTRTTADEAPAGIEVLSL